MSETETVENALMTITDATEELLSDWDFGLAHGYAEKLRNGIALSGKQRRAAYRMLRRYALQLEEVGIAYSSITDPSGEGGAPEIRKKYGGGPNAIKVSCENGRIQVRTPFKYKDVCKSVFGARWNPKAKAWTYPESPTSAANIKAAFSNMKRVETDEKFGELLDEYGERATAISHKSAENLPPVPLTKTDAWTHQLQAFWFAKDLPAVMLAMDMGTGKTKVAVDLTVNNQARRVLVLAPWSVVAVWQREYAIHAGEEWNVLSLNTQSIADRVRIAEEAFYESVNDPRPVAMVMNYEGVYREPFKSWSLDQDWDYVIFDESHRIKAANGTISRQCHRIARQSRRKLALTGTPLAQGMLDVFGQYRALDSDIFGLSYTAFSHRYAIYGGYGNYEVVGYQNEDEFNERFYSIAFRVDSDDVLDLLPTTSITRACLLSPKARKIYDQLRDELVVNLSGVELSDADDSNARSITAPNVLVKLLRLQQITGGAVGNDDGDLLVVDASKAKLLEDVVSDMTDTPVVVFCRFIHDLDVVEALAKKLKRPYGELSGRRKDAVGDDARMNPDVSIAAVQIQSGGVGVDLSLARYGVYYSLGYSLSDYLQSRKRIDRPGQKNHPMFVHLVASGTEDEAVYEALASNQKVIDHVLKGLAITK